MMSTCAIHPQSALAFPTAIATCQSGGTGFAIAAEHLSGVYRMTPEQVAANVDEFPVSGRNYPVMSLAQLLSYHLDIELTSGDGESTVLAICRDDECTALRVGEVSQPADVNEFTLYPIPRMAHPHDVHGIVSAIAVVDKNTDDPQKALRLLIDPALALGFATDEVTETEPSLPAHNGIKRTKRVQNSNKTALQHSQLLIFSPETAPGENPTYSFCLPLVSVAEVTAPLPLFGVPMSSPLMEGYVFWRKTPVPVIDLGACFQLEQLATCNTTTNSHRRLVVARVPGNRFVAFYTQPHLQTVNVPPTEGTSQFDTLEDRPSLGAFETQYGLLVVPDLATILDQFPSSCPCEVALDQLR